MTETFTAALFSADAVSHDTRATNAELARRMADAPIGTTFLDIRDIFNRGEGPIPATPRSPRARTITIAGSGGHELLLRIVANPAPVGVYLHIHGGAWIMGTADMRDADLERIVETTGLACVSVEYRLAPEHPFPAAPDDCEAAALWLIAHAQEIFGTKRLTIGGESAGAHLSVLTLLRLRDAGLSGAFCAANLAYGAYDLSMTPSQRQAETTLVINRDILDMAATTFLPADADRRAPGISPLYADLRDMPPALFSVGTGDALLDDSLFMHARWVAAGNSGTLAIYSGGLHGFNTFPGELATEANATMDRFIAAAV